jgi:alpha-L-fucosidase
VELDLPRTSPLNHAIIMEDYRQGERIREYVVEAFSGEKWSELSRGTSVGRMKIDVFPTAQAEKVRLRATKLAAEPLVRRFAVFNVDNVDAVPAGKVNAAEKGWKQCAAWDAEKMTGRTTMLEVDLSPFIPQPGQYEVKFDQIGGGKAMKIVKATLVYEESEATPGLLSRLGPYSFNVNRAAQVTAEMSSLLRVKIKAHGSRGVVVIRPRTP